MSIAARFPRFEIPDMQEAPEFWAVRLEQLDEIRQSIHKGQVNDIAVSAYGHKVWSAIYGFNRPSAGTGSWAIASNSRNVEAYRPPRDFQTVALVCGIHGAEPEAVAGAANLISLLETGKDLRGQQRSELVELAANYRLVIIPCVNMDGRSISPDTLRGATQDEFVLASQGIWSDGSKVGYPDCKMYSPLPLDKVRHPGGYPNGDGYNIQHDACPGDLRTNEAIGLLKLLAAEQADVILNMHSHSAGGIILGPSLLAYPMHVARVHSYQRLIFDALNATGLRPAPMLGPDGRSGLNINNTICMACGGLAMTFEQSAIADWSFDEALESYYVTVETILKRGLQEQFSPRRATARGETD